MPAKKETEIQHIIKVVDKLDLAIDKLSDVSSDIKQILAVHESRIDSAENVMERHFVQQDAIHQRIGKLRDEMNKESQEIREDIAKLQQWKWMVMGGAAIVSAMIGMGIHFLCNRVDLQVLIKYNSRYV